MQTIYQLENHIDKRREIPAIDAVVGESCRAVAVSFFEKDAPWPIPQNAGVILRYTNLDSSSGIYDTLPDGTPAYTISGNTVTAVLTQQLLSHAGQTIVQLVIVAEGAVLASYQFKVRVESDPSIGTAAQETYVNLLPQLYQAASDIDDHTQQAKTAAATAKAAADQALFTAASISSRYDLAYSAHSLDPQTGAPTDSTTAIASCVFPIIGGKLGVMFTTLARVRLFLYDREMHLLGADMERFDPFERTDLSAAYARLEVRYASGAEVADIAALAGEVAVYIPVVASGSQDLQPLQFHLRRLQGFDLAGRYDGQVLTDVELPLAFRCIEPNEINFESNILKHHLYHMPAMLWGTFKATEDAQEEYTFRAAYAFSGGYANFTQNACTVIEPEKGRILQFYFADDSYTVKETLIGEGGGSAGGERYRLIRKIVVDETNQTHSYSISTDEDGNPFELEHIYIVARLTAGEIKSDGYLRINNYMVTFPFVFSRLTTDCNWYVQLDKRGDSKLTLYQTARGDTESPTNATASVKEFTGKINSITWYTSAKEHPYAIGSTFEFYGY